MQYHLADHEARAALARADSFVQPVTVLRIALNMDQVRQYGPPPNPAKVTDSRARTYIETYGDESWELDALDPATITALIQEAVGELRNDELWAEDLSKEQEHRKLLFACAVNWEDISMGLNGKSY
jgi:hypothetical protein